MENEVKKAQRIREVYSPKSEKATRLEELETLNKRVKLPGKIASYVVGTIGILAMGLGMSLIMVDEVMGTGLAISIPGLVVALLACPLYYLITNSRKKRYAAKIVDLSNKIIGEDK
ncbi:MAG: hypothetical protein PHW22_02175 [Bacilli bacterium]|nr:hypothetical protein [Bacilli bacterium]